MEWRGGGRVEGREKEGRGKGYGGEREGRVQERVGREKMWGENEKIQEMGVGRGGGGKKINELKVATVCTNF